MQPVRPAAPRSQVDGGTNTLTTKSPVLAFLVASILVMLVGRARRSLPIPMPSGTAIETSSSAAPGTPGGRWRRWAMRASSPPTASNIKSTAHGSPLARRRRRTSRENTCVAVMSHDVLVLLCSIVTHGPRVDRFCNRRRCSPPGNLPEAECGSPGSPAGRPGNRRRSSCPWEALRDGIVVHPKGCSRHRECGLWRIPGAFAHRPRTDVVRSHRSKRFPHQLGDDLPATNRQPRTLPC